jgi:hypothetical protein
VIEGQLSGRGFGDQLGNGQSKTYIKGDLYWHKEDDAIRICDRKQSEDWVLLDVEKVKDILNDINGVQCDPKGG